MIGDVRRAGARSASAPSQHPGDTRVRVPGVTHGLKHATVPRTRGDEPTSGPKDFLAEFRSVASLVARPGNA